MKSLVITFNNGKATFQSNGATLKKIRTPNNNKRVADIKEIYLNDEGLTYIPPEIGDLIAAEQIFLDDNNLSTIPESIGNMPKLQVLSLENNPIAILPASVVSLNALALNDNDEKDLILFPLEYTYVFRSEQVMNEVKRKFDIDRYNVLMKEKIKHDNWEQRQATAILRKAQENYRGSGQSHKTGPLIPYNQRFANHILGFLGEKHEKHIDDVLIFDIDRYNVLMEEKIKNNNWEQRKAIAILRKAQENYHESGRETSHKIGPLIPYNQRYTKHILGFLGEKSGRTRKIK